MLVMRHGEIPVIVECNARNTETAAHNGELLTVTITADPGDGAMTFHLDRSEERHSFRATITHDGQTTDERTLPVRSAIPATWSAISSAPCVGMPCMNRRCDLVVRLVGSGMAGR